MKAVLKIYGCKCCIKKTERKKEKTQINNLPSQFKDLEKEEKLRTSRRKEIIKVEWRLTE